MSDCLICCAAPCPHQEFGVACAAKWKLERTLKGHDNRVTALTLLQPSGLLASASLDQSVRVWNLTSGKCLRSIKDRTPR